MVRLGSIPHGSDQTTHAARGARPSTAAR
jgi:hypothetical protein